MTTRKARVDTDMGVSFFISTVIHLAVFLLLAWKGNLFPANMTTQETYYVDVVNLPVANPRDGSPTQKGNEEQIAPPPPVAPVGAMSLPVKSKPDIKAAAKPVPDSSQGKTTTSEAAFAERMAKLEKISETRREEAVMERLRSKIKSSSGSGRSGMPAASGTQSGSDYMAYIQSRLKDAFHETISYSTKNPEMIVRLFIDASGKLTRHTPERSSGDRAFELAVMRAIDIASEKFTPPPDKKLFEAAFVFKPQGITSNRGK